MRENSLTKIAVCFVLKAGSAEGYCFFKGFDFEPSGLGWFENSKHDNAKRENSNKSAVVRINRVSRAHDSVVNLLPTCKVGIRDSGMSGR